MFATTLRGVSILAAEETPETWRGLLELEAERMERLAAGLSALRLEAPEPLDVRDVAKAAAPTLAAMHIDLRVTVAAAEDAVLVVKGSRGELVRALLTLAVQLVPPHTALDLGCRISRSADAVELELRCGKATSPPPLPVPIPGAALRVLPDGYCLSLPALGSA